MNMGWIWLLERLMILFAILSLIGCIGVLIFHLIDLFKKD